MGKGAGRVISTQRDDELFAIDEPPGHDRSEVEQTRAEMSETIDAIQERLAPERLTTEVSEEAQAVADHAVDKVKDAFPELSGQAEQVARDVIDHALQEAKGSLPVLTEQAQETIDHIVDHAIQEAKVALRELGAQARASVRDATIGRVERMADTTNQTTRGFSSSVVTTIKQNPGPAALTALGIGWLVMNGSGKGMTSGTASGATGTVQGTAGAVKGTASTLADQAEGTAHDIAGQAQDAVTDTTDDALHAASEAVDQVQQTASTVTSQIEGTASAAADQVKSTAAQVGPHVKLLPTRIGLMASSNPVPLGLVAVALGGAAALMVPETQREQQLLGGARDKLLDQAQSAAVDVVEKAKTVAGEAGEAVEKEAKYQGLTTDEG